jgi:hypothetical protein
MSYSEIKQNKKRRAQRFMRINLKKLVVDVSISKEKIVLYMIQMFTYRYRLNASRIKKFYGSPRLFVRN